MPRSEITHDSWGDVKIEHYGKDGDYVGSSRPTTDAWGNEVLDHYDSNGTYIGRTYKDD